MTPIESGMFEWADLSTPDVDAAQRFYRALFGWQTSVRRTDMGEYVVAEAAGREVAGMMAPAPGSEGPARWTVFVRIDDLERSLERLTSAGGTVRAGPFPIPGEARIAVVADRTGAELAFISGGPQPDRGYFSAEPGTVCWVELMTRNVGDATGFYGEVLGWTAVTDSSGPVPYTVCRLGDREVAGMIGRPDHVPADVPDGWSVYFTVTDCAAAERLTTELGGEVILPATPTPAGPFAVLADPAGAAFQVMQIQQPATTDAS